MPALLLVLVPFPLQRPKKAKVRTRSSKADAINAGSTDTRLLIVGEVRRQTAGINVTRRSKEVSPKEATVVKVARKRRETAGRAVGKAI